MSPEHWKEVERLYHLALELPPNEREEFLTRACPHDDVRREVESLLFHPEQPRSDFDQSALDDTRRGGQSKTLVGSTIGPYQVLAFLAAGGMGEVYRARHTKLHRDVALKVLPSGVSHDPVRRRASELEAKLLASLNHANIAAIYDLIESDGIQCLVLEYVEGQTLAERLKRKRLPVSEALEIARQIAEALEYAHEQGIIHRDLKPGNVMITLNGTVKVLDFGIARILHGQTSGDDATTAQSTRGAFVGTPAYMSPEQVKGKQVGRTSDIWAFGCVLFEMLAGRRAFDGDSVAEVLGRVLDAEPDWTAIPEGTPAEIRRLLQRGLRKESRMRLQNIGDARIEIEDVRSARYISEPAGKSGSTKNRLAWISLFVLLSVIAILVILLFSRRQPSAREVRLELDTPAVLDPAYLISFAVSPDGQKVVYVATVSGETRLWLRSLDSESMRPLVGTENADYPFWSSDSRSIGFFADEKLKRIDVESGIPIALANAPLGRGGAWNGDGIIVFTPNNSGPLFRVSAAGGKAEPVTKIEGPGGNHRLPHFLPDGRHFTYSGADNKAYVGVLGASETHKIVDGVEGAAQYVKAGYLVFQRSEALLAQRFDPVRLTVTGNAVPVADHVSPGAWSVSDDGVITYRKSVAIAETAQQLVWFDRGGKELERTGIPSAYAGLGFSLSPDAQQLAIVTRAAKADRPYLFLLELKRRALSRFTDLFPATYPLWAPTGGGIVFGHFEPNNNMDLYRKSTHGGAEAMLLHSDANKAATDWSADGKFILYRTPEPKTSFDVWAMSSDGTQPFPIAETEADERDAQFSTDGKWVAYQSNESGRFEIYVQPFRGAGAKQNISINGGAQVRWGRDGRELFYIALNGKLMSVPIRYSRDGKSIAAGEATPLFPAHVVVVQFDRQQYFVSPDGQQFLIKALNEEGAPAPISVILNYKPKW